MAKCNNCSKKGIFLKLNINGLCNDCERINNLKDKENELLANIDKLEQKANNINSFCNSEVEKAKINALAPINKEIENKTNQLNELISEEIKLMSDIDELNDIFIKSKNEVSNIEGKIIRLKKKFSQIKYAHDKYTVSNDFHDFYRCGITENDIDTYFEPVVQIKLQYMNVKNLKQLFNQNKNEIKILFKSYESKYTTKGNISIYRLMVIALEAELQNILANIKFGKLEKSIELVKIVTTKYLSISIKGNQTIAPTMKRFIYELEYLYIEAVKIEYEYYAQKERIKEEQRTIRAKMKQEEAERKLLEEQKQQLIKEEDKYNLEINNLNDKINIEQDNAKILALRARVDELTMLLNSVNDKKDKIINLQNGQAGYVYIISNLGSFGENVFKIGMTRRLDPQERVNELGDASVPFPFDVHSFIFSDNASLLESEIHKTLNTKRLNKLNRRKEFFDITIDELEELVYKLQPTAEFNKTLLAQQYYQSISISNTPNEYESIDKLSYNLAVE